MKTQPLIVAADDKSVEIAGFTAILKILKQIQGKNPLDYSEYFKTIIKKQEEIKSAILATNITLKKIEANTAREFPAIPPYPKPLPFPEIPKPLPFPEIHFPKTDLSETNKLLKQLLEKKDDVQVTLKLK